MKGHHREKETDSQRVHHGQASPRRSMNPCSRWEIDGIRSSVAGSPVFRIEGFQVPLQTEFSRTTRETYSFQGRLENIAIEDIVAVGPFRAHWCRTRGRRSERIVHVRRQPGVERIVGRGRAAIVLHLDHPLVDLFLHVFTPISIPFEIVVLALLIYQLCQRIKMITHDGKTKQTVSYAPRYYRMQLLLFSSLVHFSER